MDIPNSVLVVFVSRAALGWQVVADITLIVQDTNTRGYTSGTRFNNEN